MIFPTIAKKSIVNNGCHVWVPYTLPTQTEILIETTFQSFCIKMGCCQSSEVDIAEDLPENQHNHAPLNEASFDNSYL